MNTNSSFQSILDYILSLVTTLCFGITGMIIIPLFQTQRGFGLSSQKEAQEELDLQTYCLNSFYYPHQLFFQLYSSSDVYEKINKS